MIVTFTFLYIFAFKSKVLSQNYKRAAIKKMINIMKGCFPIIQSFVIVLKVFGFWVGSFFTAIRGTNKIATIQLGFRLNMVDTVLILGIYVITTDYLY